MDLRTILEHPAVREGDPVVKHLLVDFTRDLVNQTDREWNAIPSVTGDLDAAWHRGRAHLLCEVTGDQQYLNQFIL